MPEIGKAPTEGIANASKTEISVKEVSVKFEVPQSRMEYPSRFEEPPEGYNPYDSADPYYDGVDPQDVADLPTDPYSPLLGDEEVSVTVDLPEDMLKELDKQDKMYVNKDYEIPYGNDAYDLRPELTDIVDKIEQCRENNDVEGFNEAVDELDDTIASVENTPFAFNKDVAETLRKRYGIA